MAQISYDEKGTTFLYFLVSFFAMLLIPVTYWFWPQGVKEEERRLLQLRHVHGKSKWYKKSLDNLQKQRSKPSITKFAIIIAWIGFLILAYKVSKIERDFVEYDPYEVLGINKDAEVGSIKKAYRQLSKEFHPDKGGDPQTFMRIRKAYEALTNEETRRNWEEYGNPDGPQAMEFGIALPSWIVDSENSGFVLGLYVLAFMIILPIIVGMWWNRSIKYSKEKVLLNTTQLYYYFFNKTPTMHLKRALTIMSASFEFSRDHNPEVRAPTPADNVEIPELIKILGTPFDPKGREVPLNQPYSVKARTLIYCHLARLEPSSNLEEDLEFILRKSTLLVQEMVSCLAQLTALAHCDRASLPRLETVEIIMKLSPMMVQGLKESKSPLLQLPYFNEEFVKYCMTKKIAQVRNLRSLSKLHDSDRRQLLRRMGDEEYETMVTCLKSFPMVELGVTIQVLDDDEAHVITAGAIVTVTVRLTRKTLGDLEEDPPRLTQSACVEKDDDERQEQSIPSSRTKVWEKPNKKKKKKVKKPVGTGKKQHAAKGRPQQNGAIAKSEKESNGEGENEQRLGVDDAESSLSESDCTDTDSSRSVDEEEEWEAMQQTFKRKQKKLVQVASKMTHTVYAPLFPAEKQEWWWVYVCSRKRHMLLTAPVLVCTLVESEEVELKFPAPQNPGRYTYDVWLRSDAYLDCDQKHELKFTVEEARPVDEDHPQWQIDDSEVEDENALVEESEDEGISTDSTD